MVECAVREVAEETGLRLLCEPGRGSAAGDNAYSSSLAVPTPFAAVDSIMHAEDGRLRFHYVVVEVSQKSDGVQGTRLICLRPPVGVRV